MKIPNASSRSRFAPTALAWLALALPALSATPVYQVINLGTLGGDLSLAAGINNAGNIVGVSLDNTGFLQATLFSSTPGDAGNMNLGSFAGFNGGAAASINNTGQMIVGRSSYQGNFSEARATLFSAAGGDIGNVDLGTLGGVGSAAININNAGQIVGWASTAGLSERATLFSATPGNGG